jgi:hypothetical protein
MLSRWPHILKLLLIRRIVSFQPAKNRETQYNDEGRSAMQIQKRLWIAMVLLGAGMRLLPHPWNFTPMLAIGLFAGSKAQKASTGIFVTLLAVVLSDAVMGFYPGFWYVYAGLLIPVLFGRLIRDRRGVGSLAAAALASSLSFFVITNFMYWATGPSYPRTAAGLATCFAAGLPFYQNQVLGDAFYTVAIFGGYAAISHFCQPRQQVA